MFRTLDHSLCRKEALYATCLLADNCLYLNGQFPAETGLAGSSTCSQKEHLEICYSFLLLSCHSTNSVLVFSSSDIGHLMEGTLLHLHWLDDTSY